MTKTDSETSITTKALSFCAVVGHSIRLVVCGGAMVLLYVTIFYAVLTLSLLGVRDTYTGTFTSRRRKRNS